MLGLTRRHKRALYSMCTTTFFASLILYAFTLPYALYHNLFSGQNTDKHETLGGKVEGKAVMLNLDRLPDNDPGKIRVLHLAQSAVEHPDDIGPDSHGDWLNVTQRRGSLVRLKQMFRHYEVFGVQVILRNEDSVGGRFYDGLHSVLPDANVPLKNGEEIAEQIKNEQLSVYPGSELIRSSSTPMVYIPDLDTNHSHMGASGARESSPKLAVMVEIELLTEDDGPKLVIVTVDLVTGKRIDEYNGLQVAGGML